MVRTLDPLIGWVAAPKLLLTSQIDMINEDSIYYEIEGGISYYLKNPLISSYEKISADIRASEIRVYHIICPRA